MDFNFTPTTQELYALHEGRPNQPVIGFVLWTSIRQRDPILIPVVPTDVGDLLDDDWAYVAQGRRVEVRPSLFTDELDKANEAMKETF